MSTTKRDLINAHIAPIINLLTGQLEAAGINCFIAFEADADEAGNVTMGINELVATPEKVSGFLHLLFELARNPEFAAKVIQLHQQMITQHELKLFEEELK